MTTKLPMPEPAPAVPAPAGAAPAGRGRASWSGLLRLSLVAVPVQAFPAVASAPDSRCHQLHAGCGQRIRHEKRCPTHGPVDTGALVRGYEYARGQFLVLDESELDRLRPAADRALVLERFPEAGQVDPVLFSGRSLHLLPDGPAAQPPFAVLVQALSARRRWAVGRVALSGRRQVVLVRPVGRLLALHVLHDPALVRGSAGLEAELRPAAVPEVEVELAGRLLDACRQPVAWSEYRDDWAEQLAALVEAKLQGTVPAEPAADEPPLLNLVEALRQSVAAATQAAPEVAAPEAPGRKRRRPRRSA